MAGELNFTNGVVISLAVMLAACGGSKPDSVEASVPEATQVDAEDLTLDPLPVPETAGTKIRPSTPSAVLPAEVLGQSTPLFATGSEPFWTAELGGEWIVFHRPGLPLVEVPLPELAQNGNTVRFVSEDVSVSLSAGNCDPEVGPLVVVINYEEVEYQGCAGSLHDAEVGPSGDISWKNLIRPSLKAIDSCLEAADDQRLLRALYPREPGTVGMILTDAVGRMEECGADTETGEVYFIDPMSPEQADEWISGSAEFSRADTGLICSRGEPLADGLGVFAPSGC